MAKLRNRELAPFLSTRLGGACICLRCSRSARMNRKGRDPQCGGVLEPIITPQKEAPQLVPYVRDRGIDSATLMIRRLLAEN